ncbi:hypothetical protein PAPYR_12657 [Paratrimastix pyriformis]|uniref:Kringle domain-containing protein n=1 Tax=Paratrimastix pyriformis TaxID=342808 RepID=A0ABQ8U1H2_9EUKA|nr:hypothetical protein PAPYR_12657 [Paratrimastix pyriformis]
MFGCGARGYTNTGKNWCYALEGLAPVHAPVCSSGAGLSAPNMPLGCTLTSAASSQHHQHTHHQCGVAQGGPVCSLCLEWVLAHQDICLMPAASHPPAHSGQNHHTSTIRVGLCWGSVMLDVSCLLSHRLMPSCLSEAVTALGTFGATPDTRGDTVECVPPLSCLMLVLALRHAHSQHQDGYP